MKSRLFFLTLTLCYCFSAFGVTDCRSEVETSVTECVSAVNIAGQSGAQIGQALVGIGGSGMNDGSNDVAAMTQVNAAELRQASVSCEARWQKCNSACSLAINQANARKDSATAALAKKNMKQCHERIEAEKARSEQAARSLSSTATQALAVSGDTGNQRMNDEVINREPSNLPIHQVGSSDDYGPPREVIVVHPDGYYKMNLSPGMDKTVQNALDGRFGPGRASIRETGR